MIISWAHGSSYRVRGTLDCDSSNVIYVITCLKCGLQGVGECEQPSRRMLSYIRAAKHHRTSSTDYSCAIHRHFMDPDDPHTENDLLIQYVDALPQALSIKPSLVPSLRKRLEFRWIHKLDAALNIKRFLHNSFTGDLSARRVEDPVGT